MPASQARIATEHASKYLQRLCKHFAHKVSVDYDPASARVDFPFGGCRMAADADGLTIDCTSKSPEALARTQIVIDDHLARFAWREKPEIAWRPQG